MTYHCDIPGCTNHVWHVRVEHENGKHIPSNNMWRCIEHKLSRAGALTAWSYGFDANKRIYTSKLLTPKEYDLMLVKERL